MEVKNLCKAYGDRPVLENVSFTVGVGVTALWGPSGVGKTTLLRILLGLEKPDNGELMGTAVRWSAVFQEDRLLEGLDALGNLRFALGTDYEEAKAAAMLTALGLTWETGKPVRDWSGGMKRRLALARALLAVSDAVALDEPFTGLDEENRRRAVLCVAAAAETKPVILVTHDRTELNLLRANIVNLYVRTPPLTFVSGGFLLDSISKTVLLEVAAHIGKGPHQTGAQCDPKGIKSGLAGKVRRQIHVLLNGIVHGVIEGPPRHQRDQQRGD